MRPHTEQGVARAARETQRISLPIAARGGVYMDAATVDVALEEAFLCAIVGAAATKLKKKKRRKL